MPLPFMSTSWIFSDFWDFHTPTEKAHLQIVPNTLKIGFKTYETAVFKI